VFLLVHMAGLLLIEVVLWRNLRCRDCLGLLLQISLKVWQWKYF